MSVDCHTISLIDGMPFAALDRVRMGILNVAYPVGSGAGAASVATYTGSLPPNALLIPAGVAGATVDIAVTATGLTVTVTPRSPGATLAAGSTGILVIA